MDRGCDKHFSIDELIQILDAKVVLDSGWLKDGIGCVYASDLMSDILSNSKPNSLLLTGLINSQTVRTAEMIEIAAVCFVHGKLPHSETVELAKQNSLPLLTTKYSMFEACGKLYSAGMKD
jgi:predicted transcriptional regulator